MAGSRSAPSSFPANIPAGLKCSICFEYVLDDSLRGICKLHCGHFFHLACIGPEFNVKGAMICPNCRKIEDSEWRFSLGSYITKIPALYDDDSSDDEAVPYITYQNLNAAPSSAFEHQMMRSQRMLGPFPYSGPTEMPLFDYGGNDRTSSPVPFVHFRQHTYVEPNLSGNTTGNETDPPSISIFNSMGYYRRFGNGNGFGMGGSPGAGTSAGGMSSPPRTRFPNVQPLLGIPSSSASPTMAQGFNRYRELDLLGTPGAPVYYGSSSSSSAHGPPELALYTNAGGLSGYGYDQPNHSEGGNYSPPRMTPPVYGSAAFPIEIDLDTPEGGSH